MRSIAVLLLGIGFAASARAGDVPFTLTHKMEGYVTMFKVVSPEGAMCKVKSDSSFFGEQKFEVPFKFKAQANYYYKFKCRLPSGQRWVKKLEPKPNFTNIIKIGTGDSQPAAASEAAPSSGDFEQLLQSIKDASFEGEKINKLELAAKGRSFSVDQVGRLMDLFDFSAGKLKVVELTAHKLADPDNRYQILDHLDFEADKSKAKKLLK